MPKIKTLKPRLSGGNTARLSTPSRPTSRQRGYTYQWEKERAEYLRENPLCVMCEEAGVVEQATVVDHIIPHQGDQDLFWDKENNWQSLCEHHHNKHKQLQEIAEGYR